jgi:acyl-CoA dehydrogenase family protein 9
MACAIYAAESVVYMSTGKMDQGMSDYSMESAVCKVYCSEKLWDTVDKAMQVAAGNGYMREYPYERFMRDARINLIFEGTNEILRIFLALSGIKGPSDQLKELGKAADVSKVGEDDRHEDADKSTSGSRRARGELQPHAQRLLDRR